MYRNSNSPTEIPKRLSMSSRVYPSSWIKGSLVVWIMTPSCAIRRSLTDPDALHKMLRGNSGDCNPMDSKMFEWNIVLRRQNSSNKGALDHTEIVVLGGSHVLVSLG
jgi:hypothetical protein